MCDAWLAIAEETGLEVIDRWITTDAIDAVSRKWSDSVFVGEVL